MTFTTCPKCQGRLPIGKSLTTKNDCHCLRELSSREDDLVGALRALLVATDPAQPEQFSGHSAAFLHKVARPRALEVLLQLTGGGP